LLQRWFGNGNAIKFQSRGLPPYHPVVYYATLVSSLVFVGLALFYPAEPGQRGRTIDLAAVICAATLASPIAWEHHYGAFFPAFAVAVSTLMRGNRASAWLLLLSYLLMANELTRRELVFTDRWIGLLGSHIFFGAVLLYGILLAARSRAERPECVRNRSSSDQS
jgi:alpha-1,2-mannosyltransferase